MKTKRKWLNLKERIDLALRHMTLSIDRRSISKGTALEGAPYCLNMMGKRMLQAHAPPDLYEIHGRFMGALELCIDSNPDFSIDGIRATEAADTLFSYIQRRTNSAGKMEVTGKELARISSPEHFFLEPFKETGV